MKKSNSGVFVNYFDYTNTASASGAISTSAKPDSLASLTENYIIIVEQNLYPLKTESNRPDKAVAPAANKY